MDSKRPLWAALAAMVVLGLGVFTVVQVFRSPVDAPPVPELTPAGAYSFANQPPPAVPAPVEAPAEAPVEAPAEVPKTAVPAARSAPTTAAPERTAPERTAPAEAAPDPQSSGSDDDERQARREDEEQRDPAGQPPAYETPAQRNERLSRELAYRFCDKYHVPREHCHPPR